MGIEKKGPCKSVRRTAVRVYAANAAVSAFPADRKTSGAEDQHHYYAQQQDARETGKHHASSV